ncbi:transposase [Azospirillum cavernae]|uniref:transposase n=1 Tax=Azospirillum cavernae TaxID=2320860 RepID=UPI001EE5FB88|nr:transposase [Azospirillum cavernae]
MFLDETATTTKMTRLRGRAKRGQRFKAKAPFGHWGTQTFIAALRCDGLTAPWIIKGAMNKVLFETYVETQLAPTCDRATSSSSTTCPATKAKRPKPSSKKKGLFSAPLHLNPIEMAFAKLKAHLHASAHHWENAVGSI